MRILYLVSIVYINNCLRKSCHLILSFWQDLPTRLQSFSQWNSPTHLLFKFKVRDWLERGKILIQFKYFQNKSRWVREVALVERLESLANLTKLQDQVARIHESIYEGIASCVGLKRCSQTINYNVSIKLKK